MPSTYSTNLRLELIADGEKSGTWGGITNTNLGTLIEQSISGVANVAHDDSANYSLTTSNGATDEARNAVITVTGTLTAARNVVCPSVDKVYIVRNGTTGGFDITFKTSGGTGVVIPNGSTALVYCDATNVLNARDNAVIDDLLEIVGSSAGNFLIASSTDAGSSSGPDIKLYRNSASPADGDALSKIVIHGNTDNGSGGVSASDVEYASLAFSAVETNESGGEAGKMSISLKRGGTSQEYIAVQGGTTSDTDNDSIILKTGGTAALSIDNSQNVSITGSLTGVNATLTTADNSDNLTLTSTDADANSGPNLKLYRNSASPADGDALGFINFYGENDADEETLYGQIRASIADASDGTEDARFIIQTAVAGTQQTSRIELTGTETVINEDSKDLDFRVESDNNTHALFVQGSDGNVGVNESGPTVPLEVKGAQGYASSASNLSTSTTKAAAKIRGSNDASTSLFFGASTGDAEQYIQSANGAGSAADDILLNPFGGNVGIGVTTANNYSGFTTVTIGGSGNADLDFERNGTVIASLFTETSQNDFDIQATNDLVFQSGGSNDRVRINSSGDFFVAKSSQDVDTVGHELRADGVTVHTASGASPLFINRKSSDGAFTVYRFDDTTRGFIGTGNSRLFIVSDNGSTGSGLMFGTNGLLPVNRSGTLSDNTFDVGSSSYRFDDIFATNGTIQTSDQNEKQQIASLTDAEITAAKAISKLFKTFKWNDSVASKGDNARTHTGHIAQEVKSAMTDAGLDATKYAFFCSDTWWEHSVEVPAVEAVEAVTETQTNEEGDEVQVVVKEAVEAQDAYTRTDTYDTAEEAPEGATERTRLGIRYPELLAFVGAATEQRLTSIEARLTALEG